MILRNLTAMGMLPLLALLSSTSVAPGGQVFDADAILGTWLVEHDGEAIQHIEISKCEDRYCGRIVWLREAEAAGRPRFDEKNRDESLRDRPLLGLTVLTGYTHEKENIWSGGELYAFEKGRMVSPKIRLIDYDKLELRVRFLMFKKTFIWKRVPAGGAGSAAANTPQD